MRAVSLLQRDEFIIPQCTLLKFRKLMKSICSPNSASLDSNDIKNVDSKVVDKLKTIHAVHQFVPYAKSRLAIWDEIKIYFAAI